MYILPLMYSTLLVPEHVVKLHVARSFLVRLRLQLASFLGR